MRLVRGEIKFLRRLESLKLCSFGGGGSPPAPDYQGAAVAQGAANLDTARAQGRINNPSFTNAYGGRDVTFNPDDTVNVKDYLSPAGQSLFDQQQRISQRIGNVAESGVARVGQGFATPFDTSKLPGLMGAPTTDAATRQHTEDALMQRQQPLLDRNRAATETQLANQGIMRGSEAWKNSQDDLSRAENDARLATIAQGGNEEARQFAMALQGGQFGNQERQQAIQEQSYLRSLPLNEINALRTGSQVGMPQFQNFNGNNSIAAPNIMGATQAGYDAALGANNADQAQRTSTANAGLSAATMAGMASMSFF